MSSEYDWLKNLITEKVYVIPEPAQRTLSGANEEIPMPDFRGGNTRHILILLNEALNRTTEQLLFKIMQSAGLDWDDIALVIWPDQPRADLIKTLDSHVVISFGLDADPWCDALPYEIMHANGLSHLRADSLASINGNVELKRNLWSSLKILFGV